MNRIHAVLMLALPVGAWNGAAWTEEVQLLQQYPAVASISRQTGS